MHHLKSPLGQDGGGENKTKLHKYFFSCFKDFSYCGTLFFSFHSEMHMMKTPLSF